MKGCSIDGVAYGDTSFVVGVEDEFEPINHFTLEQNYPNPFNPTTRIDYSIPTAGIVLLLVYDALGEMVNELVNEWQSAGNYSVDFTAQNLTSGVYLYRLKYRDKIISKK